MSQLAIKGHSTRGKEVINLLEMLGGINYFNFDGAETNRYYYIESSDNKIYFCLSLNPQNGIGYTLEEFLEKFPYKVGDKVYYDNKVCDVIEMFWNSNLNNISYGVCNDKIKNLAIVEELQPYKEETMENKLEQIEIDIPNGYEFFSINDNNKVVLAKKQSKYPKTYEECCKVLGIDIQFCMKYLPHGTFSYRDTLIYNLQELIICRDAYWKIAGDWKPNWKDFSTQKYSISVDKDDIILSQRVTGSRIFVFPTEEMRDAFYENFKELINDCKELL